MVACFAVCAKAFRTGEVLRHSESRRSDRGEDLGTILLGGRFEGPAKIIPGATEATFGVLSPGPA